jgi:N-acetylneuraminic acid mutarotase
MKWLGSSCLGALIMSTLASAGLAGEKLQWTLSTPAPEPRSDYAAGVLDGRLIIAGGTYWTGSKGNWIQKQFSRSTHAFDPVSKTWEKLADLPIPLGLAGGAVIGGKMFVAGGFNGTQVNRQIFVLEKQQGKYAWRVFGEFPFDRVYPRALGIGSSLFLVGGTTKFETRDPTGTCCTSKTATRSLLVLDTKNPAKGWRKLAPFPGPDRFYFNAETDGRSVWMFGGIYQANPKDAIVAFKDVCRYDVEHDKWEPMNDLPEVSKEGNSPSPVFIGDGFALMNDFQKVWTLDLKGQNYQVLSPLPEAAQVDRYVWINHTIIGASGENFIQGPRRRSDWVFVGTFHADQ